MSYISINEVQEKADDSLKVNLVKEKSYVFNIFDWLLHIGINNYLTSVWRGKSKTR